MDERLPWTRQPNESRQAFAAFSAYRDLGPGRSIDKAYAATRVAAGKPQDGSAQRAPGSWFNWSRKWSWVARAEAWDAEQDRLRREKIADELAQMHQRHGQLAAAFLGKLVQRLGSVQPDDLSPSDMARWLDTAVKIERLARGVPAEVIAQDHHISGALEHEHRVDLSRLSDEDLDALERLAERAVGPGDDQTRAGPS